MSAGLYALKIEQGATFSLTVTWQIDAAGTPQNLTGYTAKLEIRDRPDTTGTLIFRFATSPAAGEGTITLGGAAGTVTLAASATLTGALTATVQDDLFYDLELTSGSGTVTRLLQGKVTVVPQVTN